MELAESAIRPTGDASERTRIVAFEISGKIFGDHSIQFPYSKDEVSPSILLLAGRNGSGKTTILRMIAGLLELNFDVFRSTPFDACHLILSDGNVLSVRPTEDKLHPLKATFGGIEADLFVKRGHEPDPRLKHAIKVFRDNASPILQQIDFELLDIHRSIALRSNDEEKEIRRITRGGTWEEEVVSTPMPTLALRVRRFAREAQLNYRKFFAADELELLPRILERFEAGTRPSTQLKLKQRVEEVQSKSSQMKRFGLQTDDADLRALHQLLDQHE
jgi:energy-coupling factor transporter ATP-binding protein EcfA2